MSRIPTVGMEKAYREITTTNRNSVSFYMAHTLEYSYDPNTDIETICYIHYGVLVGLVRHFKTTGKIKISLSNNGWSQTDACNFTGLLVCMGIYSVRCYRHNDNLYLSRQGKKTGVKEVVLE